GDVEHRLQLSTPAGPPGTSAGRGCALSVVRCATWAEPGRGADRRVPGVAALRPPRRSAPSLDAAADEVARTAAAAPDWAALAGVARSCVACPELAATRQHVVVGDVPATGRPRLVIIGEAPGATEDETGRPFVGRS